MSPKNIEPMRSAVPPTVPSTPAQDPGAAIVRALSEPPTVRVPADFAARVAAQIATQPRPHPSRWLGWGPGLALGSGALLTVALFALAPHAAPSLTSPRFDAELIAFAELGTLLLFAPRLLRRD